MPLLGDSFPEEDRRKFAEQNLKAGSVLRALVTETNPPKIKRFIVVSLSADKIMLATLFINSQINLNMFTTEELKRLQVRLEKTAERSYIDFDSFADCSKIYEREVSAVIESIIKDTGMLLGQIGPADLDVLKQTVRSARTVSLSLKKKYGLA